MYYNTEINYDMGTVTCTIILKSIMIWVLLPVTCTIILKSIMKSMGYCYMYYNTENQL